MDRRPNATVFPLGSTRRPSRHGGRALRALPALVSGGLPAAVAAALILGALPAAAAASSPRAAGIELTPPVRQVLRQLQEKGLQWAAANDRQRSEAVVGELLATAGQLGMHRLPDLSLGAMARAVEAARNKDFVRAGWSLDAAERLDPERPEMAFAAAQVRRLEGDYPRMVAALVGGYPRLFRVPLQRYLWLQDLLVWSLGLFLITGTLFVGVLMATRGGGMVHDLVAIFARRLPRGLAVGATVALLLWPLLLPSGLLWLGIFWSLLLWGYASASERAVLVVLWLVLSVSPLLLAAQKRAIAVTLSPPVRALENLVQRRLYGGLFTDLETLRSSLPESPAVKQLLADVHRSLNQWELARSLYRQVLEVEPQNAGALLSLGAYAFYKGDFNGAIDYFKQAAAADPRNAAAHFDLSQSYSESYLFDESKAALTQAKAIDGERVSSWLRNADQERVVPGNGGLARIPEIQRNLLAGSRVNRPQLELLHYGLALAFVAGLVLVAIALHLARRPFGTTATHFGWRVGHRWFDRARRVLVPGLSAAEAGEGARAFLALLAPAALLMLPLFEQLGYRIPWGYDPGNMSWLVSLVGLLVFLGARLGWELRNAV
ncbi:MAG TPA: tetratricopeptide repeat protein [Thermoanaerobaculia bacterium]|nr:tetratricopeptide repeat protein [Thermoanaerobaculia bacterium]